MFTSYDHVSSLVYDLHYLIFICVVFVLSFVLAVIPRAFLFKRGGINPVYAFIPFVSSYQRTKMVFSKKYAWWFLVDLFLGGLFEVYLSYNEARAFGRSGLYSAFYAVFSPISSWVLMFQNPQYIGYRTFFVDDNATDDYGVPSHNAKRYGAGLDGLIHPPTPSECDDLFKGITPPTEEEKAWASEKEASLSLKEAHTLSESVVETNSLSEVVEELSESLQEPTSESQLDSEVHNENNE